MNQLQAYQPTLRIGPRTLLSRRSSKELLGKMAFRFQHHGCQRTIHVHAVSIKMLSDVVIKALGLKLRACGEGVRSDGS